LLRIWATISTPLLFLLIAVLVDSSGTSVVASAAIGVVILFGVEALTRGHLRAYVVRVTIGAAVLAGGWLLAAAAVERGRAVVVGALLLVAGVFLVANLRELRRN
jgi:asparagine N-glycosylation enzyme membrane subunit Stt3